MPNRKRHFCKRECRIDNRKFGNSGHDDFVATCIARYGKDNPSRTTDSPPGSRTKAIGRLRKTPEERLRAKRKNLELGRKSIRAKYGVRSVSQLPWIREKLRGKTKPPAAIEKAKNTLLERYGVNCSFLIPRIRAKALSADAQKKRIESWKKTMYRISRPERLLREAIERRLGPDSTQVQVIVNDKWPIDIYVAPLDTYVQVDGVYWHGLDRSLKEITSFKSERDRVIYRKMLTDAEQDAWFESSALRLVRVTDKDVKRDVEGCVDAIFMRRHDNS